MNLDRVGRSGVGGGTERDGQKRGAGQSRAKDTERKKHSGRLAAHGRFTRVSEACGAARRKMLPMHAFAIDRFGDEGSFHTLPVPEPGPGELLVRVAFAGVNPVDWKTRDGLHGERAFPLVLGIDVAGRVERLGPGVTGFRLGDRVFGCARRHGAFAEYTIMSVDRQEEPVARIPDWLGDAEAAALPIAGLTALASLARLEAWRGQSILILGSTGAVGGFVAQIAQSKAMHVLGTARHGRQVQAHRLGVDEVIEIDDGDIITAVKALRPSGIDAALDLIGDIPLVERLTEVVRSGGHVASAVGAVKDPEHFAAAGITASNIGLSRTPQSSRAGLEELVKMIRSGALKVYLTATRELGEVAEVLADMKAGKLSGKVVLEV